MCVKVALEFVTNIENLNCFFFESSEFQCVGIIHDVYNSVDSVDVGNCSWLH